ncbi:MAG: AAA family ATPase [Bryobacterales bacterium]|nr:AAA family ATPase [Bryobacterales bacterium]
MTNRPARVVAFANGKYSKAPRLEKAVPDATALAQILETNHQYEVFVFPDPDPNALLRAAGEKLGENALAGGTLILSWTGHGRPGRDNVLRLLGSLGAEDVELATAAQLGEWAARTGAHQILIILDTCSSGGGTIDAAVLVDSVLEHSASRATAWLGVIAASLPDEPALSGALSRELQRLLTEGPSKPDLRWAEHRPYIRGDDLVLALRDDWREPRQKPEMLTKSNYAWDMVRNPLFRRGRPDQVVEHLLRAARGGSGEVNYFSGREAELQRIVRWMAGRKPGLLLVTGPPGSGKSAVVGRIVSLSSREERARILKAGPVPAEIDPGEGSVHAHLQARGATVETAAAELLRRLGLSADDGVFGLLAALQRLRRQGNPAVIVVDGLDEAGGLIGNLVIELLKPMAKECLLIVATREVTGPTGESLLTQLGSPAERIDLPYEGESTERALREYVVRRLTGVSASMDPLLVAEEIISGEETQASFLLGRLVTSQVIENPVDTSAAGWQWALSATVESALERDLQSVVLEIGGTAHPAAARELMRALTLAHGSGFPADDVWPSVATAISETGITYTRDHVYQALEALSRHVIAGSEGDQPVFRIAHQRLIEYLTGDLTMRGDPGRNQRQRIAAAQAIFDLYSELLDMGFGPRQHTYLWRFGWRHLAEGGEAGLENLRRLAGRDRDAFLPDLAAGLRLASSEALSAGSADAAARHAGEAVKIWRELNQPERLCKALSQLAVTCLQKGDLDAAQEASQEASEVALGMPDSSTTRRILGNSLIGHSMTLLSQGRFHGAKLLADQAASLVPDDSTDSEDRALRALVALTSSKAAASLKDIDTALALCRQALEFFDVAEKEKDLPPALVDALATMAAIELLAARTERRDANGALLPASTKVSARLFAGYSRGALEEPLSVVDLCRGLLSAIFCRLIDALRGADLSHLDLPPVDALPALLDRMAADLQPFAGISDAALTIAGVAQLRAAQQGADAGRDLDDAIGLLRRFSDHPLICASMGELIVARNTLALAPSSNQAVDLEDLIRSQQEALSYLRKGGPAYVSSVTNALIQLSQMYQRAGRKELQEAALADAVAVVRGAIDTIPNGAFVLASLLSDQSALNAELPLVQAQLANEALQTAVSLPESPAVSRLIAFCEVNVAASRRVIRQTEGVADLISDAITRLKALPDSPENCQTLAGAYVNAALLKVAAGDCLPALADARSALDITAKVGQLSPMTAEANAQSAKIARLAEGLALRCAGEIELGNAIVAGFVEATIADAREGRASANQLAGILNECGGEMWDRAKAALADRPDLLRGVELQRIRPREEMRETVQTLSDALGSVEPAEIASVRGICRYHRSLDSARFDAAWRELHGETPDWLRIDLSTVAALVMWDSTRALKNARDYLESHPALLDSGAGIVLEELRESGVDGNRIDFLLKILADARAFGVAAAYAPWIAAEEVRAWRKCEDVVTYLEEHPELRRSEIANYVSQQAASERWYCVLEALLVLAERGELHIVRKIEKNPALGLDYLKAAWRSKDATRLGTLAHIVWAASDEGSTVARKAVAVAAIARILEQNPDDAERLMALAADGASAEECNEIVGMIGDAIAHHPGFGGALAGLFAQLPRSGGASAAR